MISENERIAHDDSHRQVVELWNAAINIIKRYIEFLNTEHLNDLAGQKVKVIVKEWEHLHIFKEAYPAYYIDFILNIASRTVTVKQQRVDKVGTRRVKSHQSKTYNIEFNLNNTATLYDSGVVVSIEHFAQISLSVIIVS